MAKFIDPKRIDGKILGSSFRGNMDYARYPLVYQARERV